MAMKTWERKQAVSIELSLCIMYELLKEMGDNTAEHIEKRSVACMKFIDLYACMKFIDLYAWKCFNINP